MPWTPYTADRYLDWDAIVAFLHDTAAAWPALVQLDTLGRTREGRPLLLVTLGDRSGDRPAFWLDGGTHATEWTGVMSTLYSISRWLSDPATRDWLTTHTVYVMPCLSPDGFHHTRTVGTYVRSTLRPGPEGSHRVGFEHEDLDGDGVVRWMRWRHPAGPWVQGDHPLVMRPRTLDDAPEDAWMLANEGRFLAWDGARWTDAPYEFGIDLNRNFPGAWEPFSMFGMDGGDSPMSEIEARVTVDAVRARRNVSVAVTNHTFTGCLLTQPYRDPSPLSKGDIQLMHSLATDAVVGTGWRVFKTCPEFMYDPKKAIVGVWADTMATLFGIAGYTLELWDPWAHAGVELKDPAKAFAEPDPAHARAFVHAMADEDTTRPWAPFTHPQLGAVEIGGLDMLRTMSNPPVRLLAETCEKAFTIHERARKAVPELVGAVRTEVAHGVTTLALTLENRGFLGTGGLARTHAIGLDPGVRVELHAGPGVTVVEGDVVRLLDPIEGWGEARVGAAKSPLWPDLGDRGPRAGARWVLGGHGAVTVRWWSLRGGRGEAMVEM